MSSSCPTSSKSAHTSAWRVQKTGASKNIRKNAASVSLRGASKDLSSSHRIRRLIPRGDDVENDRRNFASSSSSSVTSSVRTRASLSSFRTMSMRTSATVDETGDVATSKNKITTATTMRRRLLSSSSSSFFSSSRGKRNKKTDESFRLHALRKKQQGGGDKEQDETTIEFIKSLVSGSFYEEGEEIGEDEFSAAGGSSSEALVRRRKPAKGVQFFKPGLRKLTARQRMALAFSDLDSSGWWAVISSGIVFGTFILESYNIGTFGGWDVLYRDDIPWYSGLVSMDNIRDIEDAYNALFFFELLLRAWVAEFKFSFWTNPFTVLDTAATIPPVLAVFGLVDRMSPIPRFLRLLRIVRLLRFLERSPDSVLFGLFKSDSMTVQLTGVAAEFICIFVIAAGVIYDLEFGINPAVKNLNDTLYWAVLTLTGIGQPFEVVTPGGRVATVVSIFVALLVIPGQLAKLATISGGEMLLGMMEDEDEEDEDQELISNTGEVFILKSTDEDPITSGAKTFDDRVCDSCGLEMHEIDARYCRRCSFKLAESDVTGLRFARKIAKKKKAIEEKQVRGNVNVGRLGVDMMSSISTSTKALSNKKNRNS